MIFRGSRFLSLGQPEDFPRVFGEQAGVPITAKSPENDWATRPGVNCPNC